jgi:hypothetical protein
MISVEDPGVYHGSQLRIYSHSESRIRQKRKRGGGGLISCLTFFVPFSQKYFLYFLNRYKKRFESIETEFKYF